MTTVGRVRWSRACSAILLTLLPATGCTYARTTILKRLGHDAYTAASNGTPRRTGAPRPFRGVPVVLDVLTHYEVRITETAFLYSPSVSRDGGNGNASDTMKEVTFAGCREAPRLLTTQINPVRRRKLFSLDIARPAAGTLSQTMGFRTAADQAGVVTGGYLKSVNATVDERTIKDITALLGNTGIKTLLRVKGSETAAGPSDPASDRGTGPELLEKYHKIERIVAYGLFDVDAPDVELQITAFLEHHVGACHGCEGWEGAPCPCGVSQASHASGTHAIPPAPAPPRAVARETATGSAGAVNPASLVRCAGGLDQQVAVRPVLVEKDTPYLVTPEFTLYEVEVIEDDSLLGDEVAETAAS